MALLTVRVNTSAGASHYSVLTARPTQPLFQHFLLHLALLCSELSEITVDTMVPVQQTHQVSTAFVAVVVDAELSKTKQ